MLHQAWVEPTTHLVVVVHITDSVAGIPAISTIVVPIPIPIAPAPALLLPVISKLLLLLLRKRPLLVVVILARRSQRRLLLKTTIFIRNLLRKPALRVPRPDIIERLVVMATTSSTPSPAAAPLAPETPVRITPAESTPRASAAAAGMVVKVLMLVPRPRGVVLPAKVILPIGVLPLGGGLGRSHALKIATRLLGLDPQEDLLSDNRLKDKGLVFGHGLPVLDLTCVDGPSAFAQRQDDKRARVLCVELGR